MRAQVLNNSEGEIYAQLPHIGKDKAGALQHGPVVKIVPGLNLIDSKTLETLRKNQAFDVNFKTTLQPSRAPERNQSNVGKPILEIVGKEVDDEQPLKKLDVAACTAMVNETKNTDVLADWLKQEVRGDVRKVIDARISLLTAGIVPA